MSVMIESLTCYPVKGCAGTAMDSAELTATGLAHDRSFMLAHAADGSFLSQRKYPVMATIRPRVLDSGAGLAVSAPGAGELAVDVVTDGQRRDVSLFGVWFGSGVDQGDVAAEWFSTVVGTRCRLVRVPPDHHRTTSGETPGITGFADGHAVLVTSVASLDNLNARITERGGLPVPMNRFRPNIVIGGWPEPHLEDRVRTVRVGRAELGYAKRALRCQVPTIEQSTGRRDGPEPTRTLASYRREPGGGVSFGIKVAVVRTGPIAVGDEVDVSRWAPEPVTAP